MSRTVIDSLIVELGLDATGFKKGAKETDKQLGATTKKVRGYSDEMGKSISNMARQFAVAFLGIKGVQGLINLNHTAAQLGVLSQNTGVATEKLNALQEALRIQTGGEAGSATGALQRITQEQTNQRTGFTSAWQSELSRLKVGLLDTALAARDPLTVMLEMGDALKRLADASPSGRADAFNIGQGMGFDENAVNFMLQGRKAMEAQIAAQEKKFKLTKGDAADAKKVEQSIDNLKISAEHVFQELLSKLRPFIIEFTGWLDKITTDPTAIKATVDALTALGKGIQFFVDAIKLAFRGWSELMDTDVGKFLSKTIGTGAEKLHEYVNQKPDPQETGTAEKLAWGLFDTLSLKDNLLTQAPAGLPASKPVEKSRSISDWAKDYNARKREEYAIEDAAIAQRAAQRSAQSGGHVTNTVQIDSVTVNTQAKDAQGVAGAIQGALKGKLRPDYYFARSTVNQANSGMR